MLNMYLNMNKLCNAKKDEDNPGLFGIEQNSGQWEQSTVLIVNIRSQLAGILYLLSWYKTNILHA